MLKLTFLVLTNNPAMRYKFRKSKYTSYFLCFCVVHLGGLPWGGTFRRLTSLAGLNYEFGMQREVYTTGLEFLGVT